MFDRFTDRARKVMGLARQEAHRLGHDYIGTEHLLLGLLVEGSGVAADILKNLDVDPKRVRVQVEKKIAPGKAPATRGQIPFTPQARKVLELSLAEASNLGHNHIGTEHLLLGLIREEEGIATQVLRDLNVRFEVVRKEILERFGELAEDLSDEPGPLTQRVRKVMSLASEQAHRLGHDHIGTEHVLLGLLAEGTGVLWSLLSRRLREETAKLVAPAKPSLATTPLPLAPAVKAVLEQALASASDHKVGPVHLLLGLLREKDGNAARALAAAGITEEQVLAELFEEPRREAKPSASRKLMDLARQEAERLQHDHIATEHVLLALLAAGGTAMDVLRRLKVDPEGVRAEIEQRMTRGTTKPTSRELPLTAAVKRALELTLAEARALGHDRPGPEHVLLGLIREGGAVAGILGVSCADARAAVRAARSRPPSPPE